MKTVFKKAKEILKPIAYRLSPGFTVFFAMLVGSLALAVGVAIYDLTVREIDLSAAASQSQYAIYAADTGVECALYWDAKAAPLGGNPSIFATSSNSTPFNGTANCSGQNIRAAGTPPAPFAEPATAAGGWSAWVVSAPVGANAATTTFTLLAYSTTTPIQAYCAKVDVGKATVGNVLYTNVVSRGYNNCYTSGAVRLERTLRVNY